MKRIIAAALCFMFCTAVLCGCTQTETDRKDVTALFDDISPVMPTDIEECTDFAAAQEFGMDLFSKTLDMKDENPVISPASAYLCLAMVMNGAEGETLSEFKQVMGGDLDEVNSLAYTLFHKLKDTAGNTTLNIANSLWADDDRARVKESFIQRVVDYYNGEIYSADLPSREALDAINNWVNKKTNGLIPTLHEETYPEDTVLLLLNTIYLKAKWQKLFEGYATREKSFTKADGEVLTVPFMHMSMETQRYINVDGAEGLILPYDDNKSVFVALRPTDGRSAREFAINLDSAKLASYISSAEQRIVNLAMPKFNIAYECYLTDALKAMGLESAFDRRADLTSMGSGADYPLYLSYVFQKVKIEVNEKGTEAAAVTEAAAGEGAAAMEDPVVLQLDSPFVYGVIDVETGLPLFIGFLEDPSAE